jgi:hypothetical protein
MLSDDKRRHSSLRQFVMLLMLVFLAGGIIAYAFIKLDPSGVATLGQYTSGAADNPFSSWYKLLFWLVLLVAGLISVIMTFVFYMQAAPATWRRRTGLILAIVQAVVIPATLILLIINVLMHNYAAAAAFGGLGALLFLALKAMRGAALLGASGAAGADIYQWVKKRLFKPKASTHPPGA